MEKGFDELTIADDIAKQCTSMYILGLRVCNANLLLHRTTAVHGGHEMPFGNRWCRYEELGQKVPQAYFNTLRILFDRTTQ